MGNTAPSSPRGKKNVPEPTLTSKNIIKDNGRFTSLIMSSNEIVLIHNWGQDEEGRDNHTRVANINAALKERGIRTVFDSERSKQSRVMEEMYVRLDRLQAVLVCVTKSFQTKLEKSDPNDTCRREFLYAYEHLNGLLIPVVMEEFMKNRPWPGLLGEAFNKSQYIDFSSDSNFDTTISQLCDEIVQTLDENSLNGKSSEDFINQAEQQLGQISDPRISSQEGLQRLPSGPSKTSSSSSSNNEPNQQDQQQQQIPKSKAQKKLSLSATPFPTPIPRSLTKINSANSSKESGLLASGNSTTTVTPKETIPLKALLSDANSNEEDDPEEDINAQFTPDTLLYPPKMAPVPPSLNTKPSTDTNAPIKKGRYHINVFPSATSSAKSTSSGYSSGRTVEAPPGGIDVTAGGKIPYMFAPPASTTANDGAVDTVDTGKKEANKKDGNRRRSQNLSIYSAAGDTEGSQEEYDSQEDDDASAIDDNDDGHAGEEGDGERSGQDPVRTPVSEVDIPLLAAELPSHDHGTTRLSIAKNSKYLTSIEAVEAGRKAMPSLDNITSISLESLTVEDVCRLFRSLQIFKCEEHLRRENVTGEVLINIETEYRLIEIGLAILSLDEIRKLVLEVRKYKDSGVPLNVIQDKFPVPSDGTSGGADDTLLSDTPKHTIESVIADLREAVKQPNKLSLVESALANIPLAIRGDKERHAKLGTSDGVARDVVWLLNNKIRHEGICTLALAAVKFLCRYGTDKGTSCQDTMVLLAEAGACQAVVKALDLHKDRPFITIQACWAIRNLATNTANKSKLGDAGVCSVVCRVLELHMSDVGVLEQCCAAVTNISFFEANRNKLNEAGICAIIITLLHGHGQYVGIAEHGCAIIANLTFDSNIRIKLSESSACKAVVDAIRTHSSIWTVLLQGCAAISNLSFIPQNRAVFSELGACEIIASALKTFSHINTFAEQACASIATLSVDVPNRLKFGAVGICELLVTTLSEHPSDSAVICAACWAVAHLTYGNEYQMLISGIELIIIRLSQDSTLLQSAKNKVEKAKDILQKVFRVQLEKIETVFDVIYSIRQAARSPKNIDLVERALGTIPWIINGNRDYHRQLGTAPGLANDVVFLLNFHLGNRGATTWALVAIKTLCRFNDDVSSCCQENMQLLGEAGACEVVVATLKFNLTEPEMVELACAVVADLAFNDNNKTKLGDAGACETVIAGLMVHFRDFGVAKQACAAISNLAFNFFNRKRLGDSDGCALVVSVMRQHASAIDVSEDALAAAVNLALNDVNRQRLGESGCCETVLEIVRMHRMVSGFTDPGIAEAACWCIKNLITGNEYNKQKIIESNGIQILSNLQEDKYLSPQAREQALHALDIIFSPTALPPVVSTQDCIVALKLASAAPTDVLLAERALMSIPVVIGMNRDKHRTIGMADGVAAGIVKILNANLASEELCTLGLCAIKILCRFGAEKSTSCQETMENLGHAGACDVVVSALTHHIDSSLVGLQGCWVIRNFGANAFTKNKLADSGSCEIIVRILNAHVQDAAIAEQACAAISNLAFNPTNRELLGKNGACEAVISAFQCHLRDEPVIEAGSLAIKKLILGYSDNKLRFVSGNLCNTLVYLSIDNKLPLPLKTQIRRLLKHLEDFVDGKPEGEEFDSVQSPVASPNRRTVSAASKGLLTEDQIRKIKEDFIASESRPVTRPTTKSISSYSEDRSATSALGVSNTTVDEVILELRKSSQLVNIEQAKTAFAQFDTNGDGRITVDELGSVMRVLGEDPSKEQLSQMIEEFDSNGDGSIEFTEFLKMLSGSNVEETTNTITTTNTTTTTARAIDPSDAENGVEMVPKIPGDDIDANGDVNTAAEDEYGDESGNPETENIINGNAVIDIAAVRESFNIFDQNGDGVISKKELKEVMKLMGQTVTDAQLKSMIAEYDIDDDGKIDFGEYIRMMSMQLVKVDQSEEELSASAPAGITTATQSTGRPQTNKEAIPPPTAPSVIKSSKETIPPSITPSEPQTSKASGRRPSKLSRLPRTRKETASSASTTQASVPPPPLQVNPEETDSTATTQPPVSPQTNEDSSPVETSAVSQGLADSSKGSKDVQPIPTIVTVQDMIRALQNVDKQQKKPGDAVYAARLFATIPVVIREDASLHRELGTAQGVAKNILFLLKAHKSSKQVVVVALHAIKALCRYGDVSTSCSENIAALGDAGVCDVVLTCVNQHPNDPGVLEAGCGAIRNLAASPENKTRLGNGGACEFVVEAIRHNTDRPTLGEVASGAIANLAANDHNRSRLSDAGACEAVVHLLRLHGSQSATLATQACAAILNLAFSSENKVKFGLDDTFAVIISTIKSHNTNSSVIEAASSAILKLITGNSQNKRSLAETHPEKFFCSISDNKSIDCKPCSQVRKILQVLSKTP